LGALVVTATCGNPLCVNPRHLTVATKQQIQSRRDRANRNNRNSGVRNVYRDKKRWRAQITENGIAVHIGTFDSVAEADAAVRKVRARISARLPASRKRNLGGSGNARAAQAADPEYVRWPASRGLLRVLSYPRSTAGPPAPGRGGNREHTSSALAHVALP
jgi:hypothetical protein